MSPEGAVVGLDLGGTTMLVGVADLDGNLLESEELPTRAPSGAEQAIDRALSTGRALLARHGGTAAAVGLSTMGITYDDRVALAPNVPGWGRLQLRTLTARRFPDTPILIENDVKAAALAELTWGALRGVDVGIYLNLGTGIAAALIIDGRVVHGANGAAGEIGYQPLTAEAQEGFRDGHAPLEEYVGGHAISAAYQREHGEDVSTHELCRRAAAGEPRARSFLGPRIDAIGFGLVALAITLDAGLVCVGGGLARSEDVILVPLAERLARQVPFPPRLVPAVFTERAGLVGAVALARTAARP